MGQLDRGWRVQGECKLSCVGCHPVSLTPPGGSGRTRRLAGHQVIGVDGSD